MFSSFPSKVQICDVATLMGLKVGMEFGTYKKIFKISIKIISDTGITAGLRTYVYQLSVSHRWPATACGAVLENFAGFYRAKI